MFCGAGVRHVDETVGNVAALLTTISAASAPVQTNLFVRALHCNCDISMFLFPCLLIISMFWRWGRQWLEGEMVGGRAVSGQNGHCDETLTVDHCPSLITITGPASLNPA